MKIKRYLSWLILLLVSMALVSCHKEMRRDLKASRADSILFDVGVRMEYDSMLYLANRYEEQGLISELDANRWRGVAYYHQGHYRMSEIYYRKAIECEVETDNDQLNYNKCARRLSELLLVKGDLNPSDIVPVVKETFEYIANYEGDIPGANVHDCGNYTLNNLPMARWEARKYLVEVLNELKEENLNYPA